LGASRCQPAEGNADNHRNACHKNADEDGRARTPQYAAQQVAPQRIGAQQVDAARQFKRVQQALLLVWVRRYHGAEDG